MQIYIVRTRAENYEIPIILGYYTTEQAANVRLMQLAQAAEEEGDSYPLDVTDLVIETVTLDEDVTPPWM